MHLVGLSHQGTPLAVRERAFVPLDRARELAAELAVEGEAVCLSTCNRTELYLVGEDAERRALDALAELSGLDEGELRAVVYRLSDEAAALHLFRVAAGLDSMVPGEGEILGQVRSAFEAGTTGPVLDRVFRQALHAGKKVRTETAIAESPASVSAAAAALAQQVFGQLEGCQVAPDRRRSRCRARRPEPRGARREGRVRRQPLAPACPGAGHAIRGRRARLRGRRGRARRGRRGRLLDRRAGVGVDAETASRGRFAGARAGRSSSSTWPSRATSTRRSTSSTGASSTTSTTSSRSSPRASPGRRREAARAEAIVAEEAERFREWQASREVVPAIASLRAWAEEIRAAELRARAPAAVRRAQEVVDSVTARLVDKLLHLPTVRLKEAAAGADGGSYAQAVRHLFGLGDDKE